MGVVTARLVFLAFVGLTGTIIYNALYLQEHGRHDVASVPATTSVRKVATETIIVSPPSVTNVSTPPAGTDSVPFANTSELQLIIRAVQRELAARGYDAGPVDGHLSDKTRSAIASFQKKEGLPVTGVPSDDLLRQILLGDSVASTAATGSVGGSDNIIAEPTGQETVMRVQQVLADLGYAPGPVDGAWGENTASAIGAFQRDRNLPQTGQITPELLDEFERVTGRTSQ